MANCLKGPAKSEAFGLARKATKSRIIKTIIRDGREYQLHATKGWRNYRVAA